MKGVKTMSLANGASKKFHCDDLSVSNIRGPSGLNVIQSLKDTMEENKLLKESLEKLTKQVKELNDKYDSLETE